MPDRRIVFTLLLLVQVTDGEVVGDVEQVPFVVAIQQASGACCGVGVLGVLSGWFQAGWYPRVPVEQGAEGVEFADAPFGGGGQVGLDDGEVGESFDGAPASSGAALLDLDRAQGAVG